MSYDRNNEYVDTPDASGLSSPAKRALLATASGAVFAASKTWAAEPAQERRVNLNLLNRKNLNNWCEGMGADETEQMRKAIAECNAAGVQVLECTTDAQYKWTGALELAPRLSIAGNGCKFLPQADGFKTMAAASDHGMTFYRDFWIDGGNTRENSAFQIAFDTALKRTHGIRFENLMIDNFFYGIQARSMWGSIIDKCKLYKNKFGVSFVGQCVSNTIRTSQIVSEVSTYGDRSIGVFVDYYVYSDGTGRRPEAIRLCDETMVYGYDTNVFFNRCFHGSVTECDIDSSLRYGVRVAGCDGGMTIRSSYIGSVNGKAGPVTGISFDDLGATNPASLRIEDNDLFFVGKPVAGSVAIYVGVNRTGKKVISGNDVGQGAGIETALSLNAVSGADISSNVLAGTLQSLKARAGGNNSYRRNTFNGAIARSGNRVRDWFDHNDGSTVTCYHGPISMPAGANSVTLSLTRDLGLPGNPVTTPPASLLMVCQAFQYQGDSGRGLVRARYDEAGNIIVNTAAALNGAAGDIWVDMEAV
ncbi:hypothetical protein [Azohydromonas lata]|uniref:Uncharacterized protein n=1 Tax=Azohydromonas lata TaxID=45677 RepID=A0ABU5IC30_9BURK|nr:hypothetical protein [Azohydromonas lata]MDZ5456518.1 hypothetical protein [Azohydromonas lata]